MSSGVTSVEYYAPARVQGRLPLLALNHDILHTTRPSSHTSRLYILQSEAQVVQLGAPILYTPLRAFVRAA